MIIFGSVLKSKVQQVSTDPQGPGKVTSTQGEPVDAQALVRQWGITPERAKQTIRATTQRGIRDVRHPTLSRRYPTNDRMFRYPRLPHKLFTDTMFAKTKSYRGNACAQVFASQFGWARAYGMRSKGLAHKALSHLFKTEGVPPDMVMDGSKEQTQG